MTPDPLSAALFSNSQSALLALLYGHPDEAFYLRRIVALTGLAVGQVQREANALAQAGILRRTARDRHVYFQADAACPIFQELRGIVTKTAGAAALLRQALNPLAGRIAVAFIYGSVARGAEGHLSDVDLLVIGSATFAQVADAIRKVEPRLHRAINPTVYRVRDFRAKLGVKHHFLTTVLRREKIFVIGGEHELGTLLA